MSNLKHEHSKNMSAVREGRTRAEDISYEIRPSIGCFEHISASTNADSCDGCRSNMREREEQKLVRRFHRELAEAQDAYDKKHNQKSRSGTGAVAAAAGTTAAGAAGATLWTFVVVGVVVLVVVFVLAGYYLHLVHLVTPHLLWAAPLLWLGTVVPGTRRSTTMTRVRQILTGVVIAAAGMWFTGVEGWTVGDDSTGHFGQVMTGVFMHAVAVAIVVLLLRRMAPGRSWSADIFERITGKASGADPETV